MIALAFTVPGPPVPKARARVVSLGKGQKAHAHTPAKTRAYEKHVGMCALAAVSRCKGWRKDWGLYAVAVTVYREEARGDADNYMKAIGDAMNGIVYFDDAAVRELHVVLEEDPARPRVEVRVEMRGEESAEERRKRTTRERARVQAQRCARP